MTGLSSFDLYFRSTIFPFLFLMSSRPSSVLLFLCSSVALCLRFSVPPLFLVFHVPSSLPFHVFCFPLPTFRRLVSWLFLSSFSSNFPRHYSSLQSSNFDSTLQKRWETNANQQTLLTGHSYKIFLLWGGRLGALFYPQIFARVACSVIFHLDLFVCLNTILAIPS